MPDISLERLDELQRAEKELAVLRLTNVHTMFADMLEAGLGGLSHEDGWTLMPTATANELRDQKLRAEEMLGRAESDIESLTAILGDFKSDLTVAVRRLSDRLEIFEAYRSAANQSIQQDNPPKGGKS